MSNALAEQRATKKRAQDDVKLLANRIALLKLEEKKVSTSNLGLWAIVMIYLVRLSLLFLINCMIGMEENWGDEEESGWDYEGPPAEQGAYRIQIVVVTTKIVRGRVKGRNERS